MKQSGFELRAWTRAMKQSVFDLPPRTRLMKQSFPDLRPRTRLMKQSFPDLLAQTRVMKQSFPDLLARTRGMKQTSSKLTDPQIRDEAEHLESRRPTDPSWSIPSPICPSVTLEQVHTIARVGGAQLGDEVEHPPDLHARFWDGLDHRRSEVWVKSGCFRPSRDWG